MKRKGMFFRLCCAMLLLCMLPITAFATPNPPSQAGERKIEGGQRDFLWPTPGNYNLTSCFLDNRGHYSLDMDGEMGDPVVASYAGEVIGISKDNSSTGWGNYVLLQHTYTLKGGSKITLYSRYAHLKAVLVSVGDSVTAGQKIGTVGATGDVNTSSGDGSHLDYEILYGGTSPSSKYSVDPYVNELLELPSGLYTSFGQCCKDYVKYAKEFYGSCSHEKLDAQGKCTACDYVYNWKSTRSTGAMGYYTVKTKTAANTVPYAPESGGETLSAKQKVSVNATVVNAFKETWYEVAMADGTVAYAPKSALSFQSYFDSQITGTLTTLTEGQTLQQASHRLDGRVTSNYPLRKLNGYLDGNWYASWSGNGDTRELYLRSTSLNRNLSFSTLEPGAHTLTVVAEDSTGREEVQIITCTFQIEGNAPVEEDIPGIKITFEMEPENLVVVLEPGQALGELPVPVREGEFFRGWYTQPEEGEAVDSETVPEGDMTLYARWQPSIYTVTFEKTTLIVLHGECITEFPKSPREGYRVVGWYTLDGTQITENTPITSDLILHAELEIIDCVLTLDPKGGSVSQTEFTLTYGDAYGELPVPVLDGYVFQGWRLGGQIITPGTRVKLTENHTAVAIWEKEGKQEPWLIPVILLVLVVLGTAGGVVYYVLKKRSREEIWK